MKKKKNIIAICTSLMILLFIQGCSAQKNMDQKKESNYKSMTESIAESEGMNTSQEKNDKLQQDKDTAYISSINGGCKLAHIGDSVTLHGLSYTVNSVSYTKQQGAWDDISGDIPVLDENKTITAKNQYYVVVNVTVKNIDFDENKDGTFYWNMIWLDSLSKEYHQIGPFELDSASIVCQSKEREENDNVYKQNITKGEEVTTDLIYLVDLDQTGTHPYFMLGVNPSGLNYSQQKPTEYFEVYLKPLTGAFEK